MSGMKMKKPGSRKMWLSVTLVALLIVAITLLLIWIRQRDPAEVKDVTDGEQSDMTEADMPEQGSNALLTLGSGINVISVSNYAGYFVEDGSDEIVDGIPVAVVENTGTDAVQFMNFSLSTEDGSIYEFELTTLLPEQRMIVLEKNRAEFKADKQIISATVNHYAVFAEEPSMHTDVFELRCMENALIVKNISKNTVSAGKVFYKNTVGDLLAGGITYMVSIPELEPGTEVKLNPSHFQDGESRILFVTYAG